MMLYSASRKVCIKTPYTHTNISYHNHNPLCFAEYTKCVIVNVCFYGDVELYQFRKSRLLHIEIDVFLLGLLNTVETQRVLK